MLNTVWPQGESNSKRTNRMNETTTWLKTIFLNPWIKEVVKSVGKGHLEKGQTVNSRPVVLVQSVIHKGWIQVLTCFNIKLAKNEINIQIQKSENEQNANKTMRINMVKKKISEIRKHTKKVKIRKAVRLQDGCECMDCPPLWLWGCQETVATLPSITRGGERCPDLSWKAQSCIIIIQGTKRACLTLGNWPGRQAFSTWRARVHRVVKTTSLHCPYSQFGSIWFLTLLVRTTFYKVVFPPPVLSLINTSLLLPCFVPSMVSILDSTTWSCVLLKKLTGFFVLSLFYPFSAQIHGQILTSLLS